MSDSEEWTLTLPADVSEELAELDDARINQVVSDALRDALDLARSAEDKRDELRESMNLDGKSEAELEGLSPVERKQKQLKNDITGR